MVNAKTHERVVFPLLSGVILFVTNHSRFKRARMSGKKEKIEGAAEKNGKVVSKGLKESARVVKRVGKGIKKEIKKE